MRSVTGIELGSDSCVVARVRPARPNPCISAVFGLGEGDWSPDRSLAENLRELRVARRFPRRARVVAWGMPDSVSPTDPVTRAALAPLIQAGFVIDDVLSPPQALAELARQRPRPAGRDGAAWLALNRQGAAIAIVSGGELLFSRVFDWHYRSGGSVKAELLRRYSLVAHLAPELRHGFDVVRTQHGATVNAIVTCGDLPELRSLTMPLIEEMDIEVETLDTLDGLDVERPATVEEVADKAPALRLVAAAATRLQGERSVPPARLWMAAAAIALIVLAGWAVAQIAGARKVPDQHATVSPQPVGVAAPRARRVTPPAPTPEPGPAVGVGAAPTRQLPAVERPVELQAVDAAQPAATMGRLEPPRSRVAASRPEQRAASRPVIRPLADPLPMVNSILVAPERRLAVVNGEIVREGDTVGRRVLIRIEPGALLLREPSGYEVRVPIRRKVG